MRDIDFGATMTEREAALYEEPFAHVAKLVKPQRMAQRDKSRKTRWWLHGRTGVDMRAALLTVSRYIATPRVAKHRLFVWLDTSVWPDSRVYAIARDDEITLEVGEVDTDAVRIFTTDRGGTGANITVIHCIVFDIT